jgi:hypothetical protein
VKHVNLRLPDDIHQRAVEAATDDDRSLNSWLISVIRRATETPTRLDGGSATPDLLRRHPDSPPP